MAKKYFHFDLEVQDGFNKVFDAESQLAKKPDNKQLQRNKRKEIKRLMTSIFNLNAFGVGTCKTLEDGQEFLEVKVADLLEAGAIPGEFISVVTDDLLDAWQGY
jgi:hypothetical protein